jgi:hypothetical protein
MEGAQEWVPEQGTPQGAVISPLLSNIYLDPLDHLMAGQGFEMVRYADDFVVLCRSPQDAAAALAVVQEWTAAAGLTLHPVKTRLVDARTDGFDFLGYHFEAGPSGQAQGQAPTAAHEEPDEVQGHRASEDKADGGAQLGHGDQHLEPDAARLVRVFQAQPSLDFPHAGRLDTPPAAQPVAQTAETEGHGRSAR